jgi:hypothetical protein
MHSPKELPMVDNAKLILNWCKKTRYKAYYLRDALELVNELQIADRGKCHLLLLPEEAKYPDYLLGIKQGSSLPDRNRNPYN